MKLWVFSDLHLDVGGPLAEGVLSLPDADVAVVAGDISGGGMHHALRWLETHVLPVMPVVFVPGNHEYYGTSLMEEREQWRERYQSGALPERLHLLDCDSIEIGGVRFLGATLWTDFKLDDGGRDGILRAQYDAAYHLNDYRAIAWRSLPQRERLTPEHTRRMHRQSLGWLTDMLAQPFRQMPYVVVTHHAPSPWSVHIRYRDSLLNPAFASDLDDLLKVLGPDLWVHGHVHDSFDYVVGETRVLCNPRGYGNENHAFDPGLVVEVETGPRARTKR